MFKLHGVDPSLFCWMIRRAHCLEMNGSNVFVVYVSRQSLPWGGKDGHTSMYSKSMAHVSYMQKGLMKLLVRETTGQGSHNLLTRAPFSG